MLIDKQRGEPPRLKRERLGGHKRREAMPRFDRIIPLLVYEDIQAAHDFLVKVFGFEARGVTRNAEGQPVHGEVRAGETTIWLHRVTPER